MNSLTKTISILGLIVLAAFAIYGNTLHSSFHLDDVPFIVKNPTIRDITNLELIGKSILGTHARHVVFFSFALNYHLNKLDEFGYHFFNILIHIFTTIGIWQFCRFFLSSPRFKNSLAEDNRENIAIFAALLFLCHPANTQAITYVSQRFASMATLFYISTLAFYFKARLMPSSIKQGLFFLGAGLSALLGIFCKEITITLPIMILVLDQIFMKEPPAAIELTKQGKPKKQQKIKKRDMPWFIPLILLGLVFIIPALFGFEILTIFKVNTMASSSHDGDVLTSWTFILTKFRVIMTLLRLLVCPINQTLDYDFAASINLFDPITTFWSLAGIISLLWMGWINRKKHTLAVFGILWFLITYAPEFYPRVHVIFEHKLYLTSIGFFLSFVGIIYTSPKIKKFALWILIPLVIISGILTIKRNAVWKDEVTLWTDIVKKSPNKYRSNLNLGNALQLLKKYDESLPYYEQAIKVNPYGYKALNSRGVVRYIKGDPDGALEDFEQAIGANPQYEDPYNNRANILKERGMIDEAIASYTRATKVGALPAIAYKNRGEAFANKGDLDKALSDYEAAIAMDPKLKEAYNLRGAALKKKGLYQKSIESFTQAIAQDPSNAHEYYVNRGNIYSDLKEYEEAIKNFKEALKYSPNLPEALFNAGVNLVMTDKLQEAEKYYSLAIRANPSLLVAYNNRGDTRRKLKNRQGAIADFEQAEKIAPKNPMILNNLLRAYIEGGKFLQAKAKIKTMQDQDINVAPEILQIVDRIKISDPKTEE